MKVEVVLNIVEEEGKMVLILARDFDMSVPKFVEIAPELFELYKKIQILLGVTEAEESVYREK